MQALHAQGLQEDSMIQLTKYDLCPQRGFLIEGRETPVWKVYIYQRTCCYLQKNLVKGKNGHPTHIGSFWLSLSMCLVHDWYKRCAWLAILWYNEAAYCLIFSDSVWIDYLFRARGTHTCLGKISDINKVNDIVQHRSATPGSWMLQLTVYCYEL